MIYLKPLTNLKELDLANALITDDGLKVLTTFNKIKKLNLAYAINITDAGLEHLKSMKQLESLDILRAEIPNLGMM